jgi:DNA-binding NarL/FixJ family response regulator
MMIFPSVVGRCRRSWKTRGVEHIGSGITIEAPLTRILVLTTFGEDEVVFEALRSGADGFLLKDTRPEDLLATVHAVAAGESRLDPAVTAAVVNHFRRHAPSHHDSGKLDALTPREREVLALLARGLSNAEIAAELVVSAGTVKTHVASVLAKLGVRDRVQAVIAAYEGGLVRPRRCSRLSPMTGAGPAGIR